MPHAKVLIADDHPFVLECLVNLLADRFEVVGTVGDGTLLIEAAARLRPDVIVTDISMPGLNGIEATRRLKAACPQIRVIVVTIYADRDLATEAICAGASGFVNKILAPVELVTAIDHALEGGVYLTPAIRDDVIAAIKASTNSSTL